MLAMLEFGRDTNRGQRHQGARHFRIIEWRGTKYAKLSNSFTAVVDYRTADKALAAVTHAGFLKHIELTQSTVDHLRAMPHDRRAWCATYLVLPRRPTMTVLPRSDGFGKAFHHLGNVGTFRAQQCRKVL